MDRNEPETFDILKMGRQIETKERLRRAAGVVSGALLVAVGVRRGRVLGAALAALGLTVLTAQLTGRSLLEEARARLAARRSPRATSKPRFGNGARDAVDEASWQSFPASDPPASYNGGGLI